MKRFSLRLPDELYEALKQHAKLVKKNVNRYAVDLIEEKLTESKMQFPIQAAPSKLEMLKATVGSFEKQHGRLPSVAEAAEASGLPYLHVWNLKSKLGVQLLTAKQSRAYTWAEKTRAELWSMPPWSNSRTERRCKKCRRWVSIGFDGWVTKEGETFCDACLPAEGKEEKAQFEQHRKAERVKYLCAIEHFDELPVETCAKCGNKRTVSWADSKDQLICDSCMTEEDFKALKDYRQGCQL